MAETETLDPCRRHKASEAHPGPPKVATSSTNLVSSWLHCQVAIRTMGIDGAEGGRGATAVVMSGLTHIESFF